MIQKLYDGWRKKLLVGVGLDTDPNKIPKHLRKKTRNKFNATLEFNKAIVDATKDIVLAYKINIAFYEKYGPAGIIIFNKTVDYIKETAPCVFLILDVKRGDIGNTNEGYTTYLEMADSITINGYFGEIANEPFLVEKFKDKIIFVLAQTSNKGTKIQNLMAEGMPV
ncbi:MAG: orotidine-5'-phosphate decarboxylase, partial [Candidatus Woesearchaeota archaeon]